MLGWISMFISRMVVFGMALTLFRAWFVLLLVVHTIGFSIWVFSIAVESHSKETTDADVTNNTENRPVQKNKFYLALLVFIFFGLPSLAMWPIMFQLKDKLRPIIFLFVITAENGILIIVWYFFKNISSPIDLYLLLVVAIGTLVANIFLVGYIICKPKLTDQVVLYDIKYQDAETNGIYYKVCDMVFRLKMGKHFSAKELKKLRKSLEPLPQND